ncbi:hypothetical protein [Advenella kashmirensis]|nr:hypothetical protein [Advenella kashmirensis]
MTWPTTPHIPCAWQLYAGMATDRNRYIVFQLLPHTLGLGPEVWRILDKCHGIRNLGEYEGDLNIDDRIVTDLIASAHAVAEKVDGLAAIE